MRVTKIVHTEHILIYLLYGLYMLSVPVLVNEEHSKIVGECCKDSFMSFEEDISYSDGAVTQEAKLPLSVKLLQQDKTMVGQLHSLTCTKARAHTLQSISCLEGDSHLM